MGLWGLKVLTLDRLAPLGLTYTGTVLLERHRIIVDESTSPGCYGREFLRLSFMRNSDH